MKNSLASTCGVVVLLSTVLMLLTIGCKKDDGPTTPSVNSAPYGSGTLTTISTAGSLSIAGTGVWPMQVGPSVLAMYDTALHVFMLLGYQQVSGPNYNYLGFNVQLPAGVDTGTYTHPVSFCDFHALYNVDTLNAEAEGYHRVSGSVTISSASGANAAGTYSFQARRGTDQPIQFTGAFNVMYVVRSIR